MSINFLLRLPMANIDITNQFIKIKNTGSYAISTNNIRLVYTTTCSGPKHEKHKTNHNCINLKVPHWLIDRFSLCVIKYGYVTTDSRYKKIGYVNFRYDINTMYTGCLYGLPIHNDMENLKDIIFYFTCITEFNDEFASKDTLHKYTKTVIFRKKRNKIYVTKESSIT